MVCIIVGGILVMVLDDKYFCLKDQQAEKEDLNINDPSNKKPSFNKTPRESFDTKITVTKTNINQTEEHELLCENRTQFTQKDSNTDLLIRLQTINSGSDIGGIVHQKSNERRRSTVNSINKSNLKKNNIKGNGSVYAYSQASGSQYQGDD